MINISKKIIIHTLHRTLHYIEHYFYTLYRTLNTYFLEEIKPAKFSIKTLAQYIFHLLIHKFGSFNHAKDVSKKRFNHLIKTKSIAQEIYFTKEINVNTDHMLHLIHLFDNYLMTYTTYAIYENASIIINHNMVGTNSDELKMSTMIKKKYEYYASFICLYGHCDYVQENYYMLEWLSFYKYFIIIKFECKKYNE